MLDRRLTLQTRRAIPRDRPLPARTARPAPDATRFRRRAENDRPLMRLPLRNTDGTASVSFVFCTLIRFCPAGKGVPCGPGWAGFPAGPVPVSDGSGRSPSGSLTAGTG